MKVQLKNDVHINGLTLDAIYEVIGIDDLYCRVINDNKDPVLYEKEVFKVVDAWVPVHWVKREYSDGEFYLDPPEFSEVGFFEDYFDGKQDAITKYNRYLSLNGLKRLSKM
jgi:hypothetical protein